MQIRYHSRFLVRAGHETTYADIGNDNFFSLLYVIVRPTKIIKDLSKASTYLDIIYVLA